MGCTQSHILSASNPGNNILASELGLSAKEIRQLHKFFKQYDPNDTGRLVTCNFVSSSRIDFSVFFRKVLGLFDMDNSGKVSFSEFTCSIWSFLSHSQDAMSLYLFDLYDETKSGLLNITELRHMMRDLHRRNYDRFDNIPEALSLLQKKNSELNREDFMQWSATNPHLFLPALCLQEKVRVIIMGELFWKRIEVRRYENCPDSASNSEIYDRIRSLLQMTNFHDNVCSRLVVTDKPVAKGHRSVSSNTTSPVPMVTTCRSSVMRSASLLVKVPQTPCCTPEGLSPNNREILHSSASGGEEDFPFDQNDFFSVKPSAEPLQSTSRTAMDDWRSVASSVRSRHSSKVYSASDISFDGMSSQSPSQPTSMDSYDCMDAFVSRRGGSDGGDNDSLPDRDMSWRVKMQIDQDLFCLEEVVSSVNIPAHDCLEQQ